MSTLPARASCLVAQPADELTFGALIERLAHDPALPAPRRRFLLSALRRFCRLLELDLALPVAELPALSERVRHFPRPGPGSPGARGRTCSPRSATRSARRGPRSCRRAA